MEIRLLRPGDDRTHFCSGDVSLDQFFKVYAGQNQFKHYLGVTYVAVQEGQVLGYATVAPGQIHADELPAAKKIRTARYPVPILRLARLAVDRTVQQQGLGAQLLRYVLALAANMADSFGCAGVVVDAKATAVPFYRRYGFTEFEALSGAADVRPMATPMFLGMRAIQAAMPRA